MSDDPIAIMQAAQLPDDKTSTDDLVLALGVALSALKAAKPTNDSVARQMASARKTIVQAIKGAA